MISRSAQDSLWLEWKALRRPHFHAVPFIIGSDQGGYGMIAALAGPSFHDGSAS
jgi:hypothetical protein